MRTTIDAASRIVVPKRLREELGLSPGTELELEARDGALEVSVPPAPCTSSAAKGGSWRSPNDRCPS